MCPPIPLPLCNARYITATHMVYSTQAQHKVNCTGYTVGCADLGAPFVNRLHTPNRRGAQCAPKKRSILRCVGAQCAPLRANVCQSLDAVRRVGAPYGIPV